MACRELPFGDDRFDAAQREAERRFIPLNAVIELTLACNLRCLHCYNFDRADSGHRPEELAPEEILDVMGRLRRAGTLFLGFTGGEVFAHPRFFDFMDHARELHMAVQVLTNGTMLDEPVVARLGGYANLMGVSLSLYGASPAVHDAFTGRPGSFAATVAGARRLRNHAIPGFAKFFIVRGNLHEAAAMTALARDLALPHAFHTGIIGRHDGTAGSHAERVPHAALHDLYNGPLRGMVPAGNVPFADDNLLCNCARGNCAITARGDVLPCVSVPLVAGNIRRQSFEDIWNDSPIFRRLRALTPADFRSCAPCPHRAFCRRTPAAPVTLHGDYTGIDPWFCEEAATIHTLSASTSIA